MIEVYYRTARGASMARCFYDVTSAHFFIASLRRAARIFARCGSDRKQIGEVTKLDGRWHWYYDREAAEQSVQPTGGTLSISQPLPTPEVNLIEKFFSVPPASG